MNEIQNQHTSEDEIDLIELLKKVYLEKKFILKTSILVALFGVVYALFQPNEYTSSSTFIPQLSSGLQSGGSSLSGLASLAGINIGSMESSSEFPPTLYPQVIGSIPFRLELLSSNLIINEKNVSVRDYLSNNEESINIIAFLKKYTIGLPSLILGSVNNNNNNNNNSNIYSVSKEDQQLFLKLSQNLKLSINQAEGFINMSFKDKNKNIAASVTHTAQGILQKKIIEFKVQSSQELLNFTLNQYEINKVLLENLQDKRAVFVDENINISSSLYQNKLSRIESELSIAQTVVQQLSSQVEQARMQVSKNTPVFTIIKPVSIPFERTSPKRQQIVLIFLFIGFVLSCGYVLLKDPVIEILKSIKS